MSLFFTTSWDDGSVHDLRVAKLLSKYGMKGTFYVPKKFDGNGGKFSAYDRRLTEEEINKIAAHHEVGAHSLTHRSLTELTQEEAQKEVFGSRYFLESVVGRPIKMFCFPRGKFNNEINTIIRRANFIGARTTKKLAIQRHREGDSFLMDVTIVFQPFPFRKIDSKHYYWRRLFDPMFAYHPFIFSMSWSSLAKKIFKKAYIGGNYFHLYGHSWEIENNHPAQHEKEKSTVLIK